MRGSVAIHSIAIAVALLVEPRQSLAQSEQTKKQIPQPSLPAGSTYLSSKVVFKRYGKNAKSAFKRASQMKASVQKIIPDWSGDYFLEFGMEENRLLRLRNRQELLILSGRNIGMCDGYPTALAYDPKKKSVAILTYSREMEDVPNVPVAGTFEYYNKDFEPKEEVFSILWIAITQVAPFAFGEDGVPSPCNWLNDEPEPDLGLE